MIDFQKGLTPLELIGPYAYGGPVISGEFKANCEDFLVTERLSYELSGEGEHVYCWVEKENLNTETVALMLAKRANVARKQVNYAGLKDKQAQTKQWFSVHLPGKVTPDFTSLSDPHVRVLSQTRHLKKLQRGALKGNDFRIRLRNIKGDLVLLKQRLEALQSGFPNYFGLQRFGHNGQNLAKAHGLFFDKRKIKDKALKGLVLSSVRSWLFNRQLGLRVLDKSWGKLIEGDLINLCGSNSVFVEDEMTNELQERSERGELVPAGLLWGQCDNPKFHKRYEAIKQQLLLEKKWLDGLELRGLMIMPRPLLCLPEQLHYEHEGNDLVLSFFLRKGSYATMLLREILYA